MTGDGQEVRGEGRHDHFDVPQHPHDIDARGAEVPDAEALGQRVVSIFGVSIFGVDA